MKFRIPVALLTGIFVAAGAAATLTYPGAAPCNTTLQACITGAASGEVIEIATNVAIDENLSVNKSLTLRPAPGFSPVLGGGATFRKLNYGSLGVSGNPETLLIEGLTFELMQVDGLVSQASGHTITIRDNVFHFELANNNTAAIGMDARVPLTGVVSGNRVTSTGQGLYAFAITSAGQVVDYTFERNLFSTSLPAESNTGMTLDTRGDGTYDVKVYSNVVDRVGGCNCGGNAGIQINAFQNAHPVFSLNNNTVHGTETASAFDFRLQGAGVVATVNLFNNIASGAERAGFDFFVADGAVATLFADRNDSYDNGLPDEFAGLPTGTVLTDNPLYRSAAAGDLRLLSVSSLITAGEDAPAGGNSIFDADGQPRIQGDAIDIGAFEQEFRSNVTQDVPALSPLGFGGMAVLTILFAVLHLRRRRSV